MIATVYERILLCLLPVISGLLPSFEPLASRLVYPLNVSFVLAKLHVHTDETIKAMDDELPLTPLIFRTTLSPPNLRFSANHDPYLQPKHAKSCTRPKLSSWSNPH